MTDNRTAYADEIAVVALVKGDERYTWTYHDTPEHRAAVLQCLGRFASNPELSLTWYDALVLSQKVRGGKVA